MSRKLITTAWSSFIFIIIIILLAGWLMFDSRFQHILQVSTIDTEKELDFISDVIKEKLQQRDYQNAREFIQSWGERSTDVVELTLSSNNGFDIAHFQSESTAHHTISKQTDIQYSYDKKASLTLQKSLDNIYDSYRLFLYELLAGFAFIFITFYYLTYTLIRLQKQKLALRKEISQRKHAEKKLVVVNKDLRDREQNLAITLNSIGDAVITTDAIGKVTRMNPIAEKLTGWSIKDALSKHLKDIFVIINATTRKPVENPVEKVIATGETVYLSNHTVLLSKDNQEHHIADSAAPIRKDDEEIRGTVLVFNDVSERKQAEEKIRTLFQAIEQSPVSVTITDSSAKIEYVNTHFEKITGYTAEEAIGKNPRFLQSGKTPKKIYQHMWKTITNGNAWQGELLNRKKSGELYWENVNIAPVLDDAGTVQHYLAVREDITLRKKQEEKILHQAHFDALSGLPNRFLSLDRLSQLINKATHDNDKVALLFLDLDDFKKINDTLGHEIGDKLLVEAAKRLQEEISSGDTVGRLGGDEFIVLLGGLKSANDARPMAENLLNRFRDVFRIDGRELMITTSVGVAVFPDDGSTSSELLRNADSAMYHAKEDGRNTYSYYTDVMNKDVSRRLALEEQMHGALERNEFQLHYQPKVRISDHKIIGVEALLRWKNPALGDVTPQEFIPIAEQTGLIIPIGQFVLTSAVEATVGWQKNHKKDFTIAVNLSPRQFRDPHLVSSIQSTIEQSGIPADSLEMEITEGALMSGHEYIDDALTAINEMGVSIAMDDFGTGYCSLNYLRKYPFNVLKIDRSFISDITEDHADRNLVYASIAMAHSLGLKAVAEGVETEAQLKLLAEKGCEIAQGYFFSKPVPAGEITSMLSKAKH